MKTGYRTIAAVIALCACSYGAMAQQSLRIRGSIAAFDGKVISIKTNDGKDMLVDLPEAVNVAITKPFTMADVKPGMALGVTTIQRADGATVAIDIRPIPATANLGLSAYDLQPQSTMTNGTFEGSAQSASGDEIMVNYKTGVAKVLVLPTTAMSQAAPGTRADIKTGEAIYVTASQADGKITAVRVQVGKDGVKPTQ